jgi:hypothetical protein
MRRHPGATNNLSWHPAGLSHFGVVVRQCEDCIVAADLIGDASRLRMLELSAPPL